MQKNSTHSYSVRFRRFLRKNYAVFCSLHKEISIGFLSVDTNNSSLKTLKKKIIEIFFENDTENVEKQEFFELKKSENIFLAPALQTIFVTTNNSFEHKLHKYTQINTNRILLVINKIRFFYCIKNKNRCHCGLDPQSLKNYDWFSNDCGSSPQ